MYHKVRTTVVSLVVAMICLASSAGTLSYFTDTDVAKNDFVIGNASTSLVIYDDITGDKHVFDKNDYSPLTLENVPFYLQATNEGNIPVYQRFRIVIPSALAEVVSLKLPTMNDNCKVETAINHKCSNLDYTVTYNSAVLDESETSHAVYYIVSNAVLGVGQKTHEWPMERIHIDGLDSVDKSLFSCEGDNNNCTLGIEVYSDVIQTTGFTSAEEAFVDFDETY